MFSVHNRRYTGSKFKLADWITRLIKEYCVGESFFEIFAGTSVVSLQLAPQMKSIILNDTLEANRIIYEAFYSKGECRLNLLTELKDKFNAALPPSADDYFSSNYGNKYFSVADCRKIETIRNMIEVKRENLFPKEYAVLLASLIYSMDKCANTVGHFDAYIHSDCVVDKFTFDLIELLDFPETEFKIYSEDANELAKSVAADIVYIDPPYNSRQYCQFYHIYETLVRWDKPELFGIALKPKGRHLSDYCRSKAPQELADLISKLKCRYITVSYNNTYESKSGSSRNKITLEQIKEILNARGEVKSFSKTHKFFNAGKTDFANHKEMLFIAEVK
ncbi:MAG: DNA adenine methylase [Deferribacteraceae bacterium]|jgi:adenine-specific DNA-methyltransferase|nr:DNA adenine methylase [Deferribacteraceae bacterium]